MREAALGSQMKYGSDGADEWTAAPHVPTRAYDDGKVLRGRTPA